MDYKMTAYPIPSTRVLSLLQKKKQLDKIIKQIENDEEYSSYLELLRAWFMQANTNGFEHSNIDFRWANYPASIWWNLKPKEFLKQFPAVAKEFREILFKDNPASGRLTVKLNE